MQQLPTRIPGLLESFYQPVYDTVKIEPSTEQALFFQVPVNEDGKTPLETNMEIGGCFPYPKNFTIQGISVIPEISAKLDDVKKYVDRTWFRLALARKDYLVVPLSLVFDGPEDIIGKETDEYSQLLTLLRKRTTQPVFKLPEISNLDLIPLMPFRVELNSKKTAQTFEPFNLKVILFGNYRREVH